VSPLGGRRPRAAALPRTRPARAAGWLAAFAPVLVVLASCGGASPAPSAGPPDAASSAVERGRLLAETSGCQACHGRTWEGGIAPSWIGLAGSTVTLQDGTSVVADTAYLTRSITDPAAQRSGTATMVMPPNRLTDEQVADVVAFIESLGQG
jgi:cytochrome c oxidase subunit 2